MAIIVENSVIRKGDASTRYTQYPEHSFSRVKMEPIHNMLTYCKTYGSITIDNSCGNTSRFTFENDGTPSKIPTWERVKLIAENAGKSITTNKGVSRCGIGLEAFAWGARYYFDKPVKLYFNVIKNKMQYGFTMTFDAKDSEGVKAVLHEPTLMDLRDKVSITYEGMEKVNSYDLSIWKNQIQDAIYHSNKKIKVTFIHIEDNGERYIDNLTGVDFLHKDLAKNSDNFKCFSYYYVNPFTNKVEYLKFDVSDISNFEKKCLPELSGGAIIYDNVAAVNRGLNGWSLLKSYKNMRSTRNGIRFNVYVDDFIFNQICGNSAIKNECRSLRSVVNPDFSIFKVYDCDTDECFTMEQVISNIEAFIHSHESDVKNKVNFEEYVSDLNNLSNTEIDILVNAIKVLNKINNINNKKISTISKIVELYKNNCSENNVNKCLINVS